MKTKQMFQFLIVVMVLAVCSLAGAAVQHLECLSGPDYEVALRSNFSSGKFVLLRMGSEKSYFTDQKNLNFIKKSGMDGFSPNNPQMSRFVLEDNIGQGNFGLQIYTGKKRVLSIELIPGTLKLEQDGISGIFGALVERSRSQAEDSVQVEDAKAKVTCSWGTAHLPW